MEARVDVDHGVTNEGRPYRSHLHPACFSCKRRKSRCKTKGAADICIMCQAHGTECVFPRPDDPYGLRENPPRTFPAAAGSRSIQARHDHLYRPYPRPHIRDNGTDTAAVTATDDNRLEDHLMGIVAEAGDDSSHVVSPAVADDNDILESYLSAVPTSQRRSLVRTRSASNRPLRQVRFNLVPRKPLGVTANQSLAASKCEVIEKYMDPDIDEFINLWVLYFSTNSSRHSINTTLDSSSKPTHAFLYLTKLPSEVPMLLTKSKSRRPCFAIYTPILSSTGKALPNYALATHLISASFGTRPTRRYIQSYSCRPEYRRSCRSSSTSAAGRVHRCSEMGEWWARPLPCAMRWVSTEIRPTGTSRRWRRV